MPIHFGKRTLFLFTNAFAAMLVCVYLLVWLLGGKSTTATITKPHAPQLNIAYRVDGVQYQTIHMRNDVDYGKTKVAIRYLRWRPQSSRVISFLGLAAEPLGWWGIYLTASAMLLLSNNTVFSKGTRFTLQRKFPYLSMDEFFPAAGASRRKSANPFRRNRSATNNRIDRGHLS